MYTITKKIEISGAHKLNLPYESPCRNLHGHNWIIEVEISSAILNASGMVIDFKCLKEAMEQVIKEPLDHQYLNDVFSNPTAENMARWIATELQHYLIGDGPEGPKDIMPLVSKVTVQESEGNKACYIP